MAVEGVCSDCNARLLREHTTTHNQGKPNIPQDLLTNPPKVPRGEQYSNLSHRRADRLRFSLEDP